MKLYIKYSGLVSIVILFSLFFTSCATLLKDDFQDVTMTSEPSRAKVYINSVYMGETPLLVPLPVSHGYTIEFKKSGYETQKVILDNGVGLGWVFLDVITGLWPVAIDAATGNWYSLDKSEINAVFEREQGTGNGKLDTGKKNNSKQDAGKSAAEKLK